MIPAAADLRVAATAARELLAGVPDAATAVPIVGTDVRGVVRHVAGCLFWYAHDLVAGPAEAPGPVPRWPDDAGLDDLVRELGVAAEVLARVVALAGPEDRGWHPDGVSDAAGLTAVGIAELLLHAGDVAVATGLEWRPPTGPVTAVLARLFPDAPADADPWAALRWATGRAELPGHPRVTAWRYALAP